MPVTNTKENGLEDLIINHLENINGYEVGTNSDYNRDYAIDTARLFRFLKLTQEDKFNKLGLENELTQAKFLNRLQGEIEKNGVIYILRNGYKYLHLNFDMYYSVPSDLNPKSKELYNNNVFSVTRQLMYSKDNTKLALDMVIFINGLPIITFELKNQFTKQDVEDAIHQYKTDRDPKELLFHFGKCMVHFALDDNLIRMCTKLDGKKSWFLPFDKGNNNGAGNPVNPDGIKTDYLWKDILTKAELSNIIENYAQIVEEKDKKTGKIKRTQIFPRYHQLTVVKALLSDATINGAGQKYLIQHSAGSGKSNSIAWLAHQLVTLTKDNKYIFDTVIIVTDRINLDKQIKSTVKQFMQVSNTVGHTESAKDLRELLESGKKIIITIVHKFPYILDDIGTEHRKNKFAIIIDEAHSSQSGSMSSKMNIALSNDFDDDAESLEDKIINIMESRKMLSNASYFAFTATPKNKTLEMFGVPYPDGDKIKHKPFHNYTMKQAIEEGFILDVLKNYTTIKSLYHIAKTIEDDPKFDKKKALKKIRAYVEGNAYPISKKADIIIEHFHKQIISRGKINGQARAMVVCSSIERAIDYFFALEKCLKNRFSQYKCIIAFSGEKEYNGKKLTESSINGFPSNLIEDNFKNDPYRILVVANKFQTGFDEPLLHTMYVDKMLSDIKAVQTLSRLNRACFGKNDTFVLDFANDTQIIKEAFEKYYKTTILSDETDPNKLNDLQSIIEKYQIFNDYDVENIVELYLGGADRDKLDPIIDRCVAEYDRLDEEGQIEFKSSCKGFARTYGFLASILSFSSIEWEKLSIFLNLLIPKLPSPKTDDLSQGIIDAIDLDSYRTEAKTAMNIALEDSDVEIDPVPVGAAGGITPPEMDFLSNIINEFHNIFGDIDWKDKDHVLKHISLIPETVSKDEAYQNASKNSDKQTARIEFEVALNRAMENIMFDNLELYKQFKDNKGFAHMLSDKIFEATYNRNIGI